MNAASRGVPDDWQQAEGRRVHALGRPAFALQRQGALLPDQEAHPLPGAVPVAPRLPAANHAGRRPGRGADPRGARRYDRAGHDRHHRVPGSAAPRAGFRAALAAAGRRRLARECVRVRGPAAGGDALPPVVPQGAGIIPHRRVRTDPQGLRRTRGTAGAGSGRDAADERLPRLPRRDGRALRTSA